MSDLTTFFDVDGKTMRQAGVSEVRKIKERLRRRNFIITMLAISDDQYDQFMHALSVWNERASPTPAELKRLNDVLS